MGKERECIIVTARFLTMYSNGGLQECATAVAGSFIVRLHVAGPA